MPRTCPTLGVADGTSKTRAALMRKSYAWFGEPGMNEVEFFRRWKSLLEDHRVRCRLAKKKWGLSNPGYHRKKMAEYRQQNPESVREANRKSYKKHAEARRMMARRYRQELKLDHERTALANKKRNEYRRMRRASNVGYRVRCALRNRIKEALRRRYLKAESSAALLGCSIEQARNHLESLWKPGMTWDNYGVKGWHVDHIRPCASFDLSKPDQQRECFHYTNLQPLWWSDNLSKGDSK